MENEHPSQFGNQSTRSETQADKEWSEFERDLDTLGRQLAALQVHTASLGTHLVSSLEARFREVGARAWTELRAAFGKAAGRLQTETQDTSQNGPVPARTDDRHERT